MSIKTVIIENESDAIELLETLIDEYLPNLQVAGTSGSILKAKILIDEIRPDLLFLDIDLDDGNG